MQNYAFISVMYFGAGITMASGIIVPVMGGSTFFGWLIVVSLCMLCAAIVGEAK